MAFWNSKPKPFLNGDDEEWQLEAWQYLIDNLDGKKWFENGPIILPSDEFFPPTSKTGKEKAEYVFGQVAKWAGLDDWPIVLEEQEAGIDPVLAPLAVVQNAPGDPLGTFQTKNPGEKIIITYAPELLDQPIQLIATLAHELSHALLTTVVQEPPGGWENEEFVTDLTAAYLGFGIFAANTAFQYSQTVDDGKGTQGWSYSRSGYLTELEWCFAIAVFITLKCDDFYTVKTYLKPSVATSVRKALKYLQKNPDILTGLRASNR